jgi:NitT/TauT family transport system substrate-binding protein
MAVTRGTAEGAVMRFPRRRLLLGGVAAAGAAGLAGIAGRAVGAGASGGPSLRVGYLPITDAAPLLVAHGRGLFALAGVDVARPVLFRSWSGLVEAFLAGTVDVVHLLMPFAIQLRYALGAAVRVVAWSHTNGSALTVTPRLAGVPDLAGRKVAIPYWWSIHNVVLQDMLRGAGLRAVVREQPSRTAGTVELVVMSPPDMLPALDGGTIGGYIVADPFNAGAEAKRVGRIQRFVGDVWRDHACCVVLTRQDLLDTEPHRARAVVDALASAQQLLRGDRQGAARTLAGSYLPQPLPAITRALTYPAEPYQRSGALLHPDWQGQRIGFQPFPFPSFTERLVTAMRGTVVDGDTRFLDHLDPASVHRELVDDRFARGALARFGGPSAFGLPDTLTRTEEVTTA